MSRWDDQAPLPGELIHLLDRQRDGNISFNYALQTGHQAFIISRVSEMLEDARQIKRAKDRKRALDGAAEYIKRHDDLAREISRQWSAYVDALMARYKPRSAAAPAPQQECFA